MRPLLMLVAVASNIVPTPGQSSLPTTLSTQPTITITSAYLSTLSGPSTTVTASSSTSSFTESSNDTSIVGDRFAHHNYRPPYSGSSGGSSGSGSSSGGNNKGGSNYGGFTHGGSNNGGFSSGGSGGGNYGPGGHGSHGGHKRNPLHLDYGWKFMDFIFPSASARREAIRSGAYNYTSIIPLDMDVWEKAGRRKVFVTMPTGPGSPVSLGTVSREQGFDNGPLIAPYPDWSWHRRGDCNSISSVYRVAIDDYDRLWVMDRGDDKNCLPKVMAFDLNTDKLISKYEISRNLLQDRPSSNLITPVVDVRDHGRNTFVYIADVIGAIIVYDHQNRQAWRVIHPLFLPDLRYANHTIAGTNFYLADGLFGMALSPLRCEGHGKPAHGGQVHGAHVQGNGRCEEDRTLYFHALASIRENYVKTSVLRNRNNFPNLQNKAQSAFKSFDGVRPSVSAAEAMTDKGVLFSGLLPDVAVTCWNSRESFGGWNLHVVAQDEEKLQFTSGMKVRYGKLYVFSSRYQRFATNTMNWNEVNYRIQSGCVDDLTRGTKCEPKSSINS